jgi:hypothetical protein
VFGNTEWFKFEGRGGCDWSESVYIWQSLGIVEVYLFSQECMEIQGMFMRCDLYCLDWF